MKAVLPAFVRALVEPKLSEAIEASWVSNTVEAIAAIRDADIGWVDLPPRGLTSEAVAAGTSLKWLFTAIAGIDSLDMGSLARQGTIVTNGAGLIAPAVADYAVMGVLVAAKRFDQVVRAHDRREWLMAAPGNVELAGSSALVVGMGAIGTAIADRLRAFGLEVTGVTRSGRDGTLRPDEWRAKLGEFDWVILGAPSTGDTRVMIGADELEAMKPGAWLVNIARGNMIDQDALTDALVGGSIGGAFLDPTEPEPLPADHPLWAAPNCIITMHLSGRSQTKMFRNAAALFLENLDAFLAGRPLRNRVDLDAGY